ncbi:hypothetical protein [Kineosporia succinea]|uniref:NADH:ubiquinone oxidoreductase subunit 5 (Subunit L)/multisubunit Na+/H+ antiporter MnhA subunit n=1 Tax=Kineosporia succinea TaxID=84632 RepID=A0ABT9NWS9_9ACTN|nr:hypothetical protein [Kineosporia succinea]MDP9824877.1 NADH:ubiquinone oxidoreductase subunit 5 (subunit L)/multisubunit Na+/H+ antiporter MnhA subunit [Kineosporia succinea]
MHTLSLEWQAIWKIFVVSVILGAGLPALFALGIRAMAFGTGGEAEEHAAGVSPAPHPAGRALAFVIFALVLLVVALGIMVIVAGGFGKEVSFDHIYPVLADK